MMVACAWAAHFAYYLWPDPTDRAWAQYIGTHGALAVTALLAVPAVVLRCQALPPPLRRLLLPAGIGACYLTAIESGQCAACGRLEWGNSITRDLCLQAFGAWPYAAAAAALLATLLVVQWRARHG